MTLLPDVPHELTEDELGKTLQAEARRVVSLGNRRERWLRVDRNELAPNDQKFSMFLQGWQSRIHYTYTVDVRPSVPVALVQRADQPAPVARPGRFEVWRHLSVQQSVPDRITRSELNLHMQALLGLYQPQVLAFYPLAERVRVQWAASEPIPVQHPARNDNGQRTNPVTWRTVITAHFLVPWGSGHEAHIVDEEALSP